MTNPSFIHLFIHGTSEATTVYQALFFCWYGFTVSLSLFFWNGIYLPFINTSLLDTFVSHYTCPIRLAVRRLIFFLFLPAIILFFFSKIFLPSFGYAYELSHIFVKLILTHTCTSTSAAKFFRILKQRQV